MIRKYVSFFIQQYNTTVLQEVHSSHKNYFTLLTKIYY